MNDEQPPEWMRRWPRSAPRPTGPWTVTDGARFGLLDPEIGAVTPVDPAADRRLPGIAAALDAGDQMIAYRYQRRAVTRRSDSFTKIVRPHLATMIVANHEMLVGVDGFRTPRVIELHDDGRVQIEAVAGLRLHDLLRSRADLPLREVAAAMAAMHASPTSSNQLLAATLDDPNRWVSIVTRMDARCVEPLRNVARGLPSVELTGTALVHTDLHDKNVMLNERGVHFIDLDGLALGAPEIDVVNLGVHLELRALQAGHDPIVGRRHFDQLLGAYDTHHSLETTLVSAIAQHTWFRLACLYLCRPSGRRHARTMLQRAAAG